jgi:hypothetical protein
MLRMLWPKARGPRWFGDQLRSRSSSLSWRRPRPRFSWWREQLSRLLSTLRGPPLGFDGVPSVAVGPETALDRRCRSSGFLPSLSMSRRRRIQAVGE